MQKARIKNIQLIVKCYLLYNMAMNLFFRHNNLVICYIKGFLTHKYIVDIDWSTKLYDCKLKLHEGGYNNRQERINTFIISNSVFYKKYGVYR